MRRSRSPAKSKRAVAVSFPIATERRYFHSSSACDCRRSGILTLSQQSARPEKVPRAEALDAAMSRRQASAHEC